MQNNLDIRPSKNSFVIVFHFDWLCYSRRKTGRPLAWSVRALYLFPANSSALSAAASCRSPANREAEKANHHTIGNRASRGNGKTLRVKDAIRVAKTQEPTVTRRLRGQRKRAQKPRTKSQYDTAPIADVSASATKMVVMPLSPRSSINLSPASGAAMLKATVATTNPK